MRAIPPGMSSRSITAPTILNGNDALRISVTAMEINTIAPMETPRNVAARSRIVSASGKNHATSQSIVSPTQGGTGISGFILYSLSTSVYRQCQNLLLSAPTAKIRHIAAGMKNTVLRNLPEKRNASRSATTPMMMVSISAKTFVSSKLRNDAASRVSQLSPKSTASCCANIVITRNSCRLCPASVRRNTKRRAGLRDDYFNNFIINIMNSQVKCTFLIRTLPQPESPYLW